MDVAPVWRGLLELLAKLAHEHVHRAVAADHRVAPQTRVDLLALQHAPLRAGKKLDQLELAPGQIDAVLADERLEAIGADLDLAGGNRLDLCPAGAVATAAHDALHARDHFLRVARLGNPIICPET